MRYDKRQIAAKHSTAGRYFMGEFRLPAWDELPQTSSIWTR